MSPVERAARVFTPKVRGIEINREGTGRKRECVRRSGGGVGGGEGGCLSGGGRGVWGGGRVSGGEGRGGEERGGAGRASCKLAGLAD